MLRCADPVHWYEIKSGSILWCLYSFRRNSFILCKWDDFIDPLESLPVLQHIELIAYINTQIAGMSGKVQATRWRYNIWSTKWYLNFLINKDICF